MHIASVSLRTHRVVIDVIFNQQTTRETDWADFQLTWGIFKFIYLQNHSEISQLAGLEDDDSLQQELTAKTFKYKALR